MSGARSGTIYSPSSKVWGKATPIVRGPGVRPPPSSDVRDNLFPVRPRSGARLPHSPTPGRGNPRRRRSGAWKSVRRLRSGARQSASSEVRGESIHVVRGPGRGNPRRPSSGARQSASSEVRDHLFLVIRGPGQGLPDCPMSRGEAFPIVRGPGRFIPRRPRSGARPPRSPAWKPVSSEVWGVETRVVQGPVRGLPRHHGSETIYSPSSEVWSEVSPVVQVGGPLRSEVFSKLSRILDLMVSFDGEQWH